MGSNQSQRSEAVQRVTNNVLQQSQQDCKAACNNKFNNNTVIFIGGGGRINITQECRLSGIQCILKNSMDTEISTILAAMAEQNASTQSGFALDFRNISQTVRLEQYIANYISQLNAASCTFIADNEATGNYFYVQGDNNELNFSQSAEVTNSICNMDNIMKAVVYNEAETETSQTSTITSIFALIAVVIIVCVIMAGIVMAVFLRSGGARVFGGGPTSGGGTRSGTAR